jgi:hypothetical protein
VIIRIPDDSFLSLLEILAATGNHELASSLREAEDNRQRLQPYIAKAREIFSTVVNDEINVDPDAIFSESSETIWVQGWLAVAREYKCPSCWESFEFAEMDQASGLCTTCSGGRCSSCSKLSPDYELDDHEGLCDDCNAKALAELTDTNVDVDETYDDAECGLCVDCGTQCVSGGEGSVLCPKCDISSRVME